MRALSFSGLLFVCGTLTVGCNVWVDVEPADPPGGDNGYGGSGGNAGSGGDGGGGNAGSGGDGGGGNGGGGTPIEEGERVFVGGDVEEQRELFPFGVAVANDGAVFVSTLGNRTNEPSRIYRFNPGQDSAPEVLFEVGNSDDQAIYGLGFARGKLYACSSQHLLSANNNIVASIFEFDSGQLNQSFLGPNNVKNTQLRATAVNIGNNGFVVADAQEAGRCGQFATDNDGVLYVPDVSGQTDFIFRLNPAGTLNQPGGQIGDQIDEATLDDLTVSAWYEDAQLVGNQFGTAGITFDGSVLQLFLENNGSELFGLRPVGNAPEGTLESQTVNQALVAPFGVAAIGDGRFVASDLAVDEVVVLAPDLGTFNASVLLDSDDDASLLQPASIAIAGDKAVVVGGQLNQLGAQMSEDGKVFVIRY